MNKIILFISVVLFSTFQLTAQTDSDLYFVFLNTNPDKEVLSESKVETLQTEHLNNIDRLSAEGKLIAAGPFEGGGGILILKAKDQFEAWKHLDSDPAVKANRFKVEVMPFSVWNGYVCGAKEPYEMVTYQFARLISNPDFKGDERKMIHDNRIFMADMMNNNDEVLVYGFFSEFSDGMAVFNSSAEEAESLISEHPAIKAGQLNYEIKTLYIAKGTFCE